MGSSATVPRQPPWGDRRGSVQIIRPLTPCLVTGQWWGGLKVECGGSQRKLGTRGQAAGMSFEEVMIWACLQKDNNTDTGTLYIQHGVGFSFSWTWVWIWGCIIRYIDPSFHPAVLLLLPLSEVLHMPPCKKQSRNSVTWPRNLRSPGEMNNGCWVSCIHDV